MPSAFEHGPTLTVVASPTANAGVIWSAANNLGQSTVLLGTGTLGISGDTDIITLTANTVTVAGTVSATLIAGAAVKDEDNMASNSATHLASQQSIKAYVDANGGTAVAGTTDNGVLTFVNSGSTFAAEANLLYSSPVLTIQSSNSVPAQLIVHGYADGSTDGPGRISLRRSVNSSIGGNGAPTVGGHHIGIIDFEANDGNSVELGAAIRVNSTEDWDDSSRGNRMRFFTTANGSTSQVEALRVDENAEVLVRDGSVLDSVPKGVAKAWVQFKGTSTVTVYGSYGVTSITDNTTGDYAVNWSSNMSNANYAVAAVSHVDQPICAIGQGNGIRAQDVTVATGSNASLASGGNRSDSHRVYVVAYGVRA